ncbi:hypothetical protein KC686_01815 [Candidatus Woesebacteria bacterium]|nr:hypothetical protein [Candidatus Woesebacteria bacterium]
MFERNQDARQQPDGRRKPGCIGRLMSWRLCMGLTLASLLVGTGVDYFKDGELDGTEQVLAVVGKGIGAVGSGVVGLFEDGNDGTPDYQALYEQLPLDPTRYLDPTATLQAAQPTAPPMREGRIPGRGTETPTPLPSSTPESTVIPTRLPDIPDNLLENADPKIFEVISDEWQEDIPYENVPVVFGNIWNDGGRISSFLDGVAERWDAEGAKNYYLRVVGEYEFEYPLPTQLNVESLDGERTVILRFFAFTKVDAAPRDIQMINPDTDKEEVIPLPSNTTGVLSNRIISAACSVEIRTKTTEELYNRMQLALEQVQNNPKLPGDATVVVTLDGESISFKESDREAVLRAIGVMIKNTCAPDSNSRVNN